MAGSPRYRLEVATLCIAAAVAGLAVTVPIDFRWASHGSALDLQMLVFNIPRATATAALAAVVVAALCHAATIRMAWLVAWASSLLLLFSHVVARGLTSELATFGFVDAIVGGALLGALAALSTGRRLALAGLLLGALSGIVIGNRVTPPIGGAHLHGFLRWALIDPPSFVLIAAVVALIGWCAWLNRAADSVPADGIPLRPVVAVLVLVSASLVRSEWIAGQDNWLARIVGGSVVVVLATLVAALLLPARDGVLVAIAVAFAAAGGTVGMGPRPGWTVPVLVAAVAVGLGVGVRWPRPVVAVAATVALAVFEALTPGSGSSIPVTIIGGVAMATIGGYCFGAIVPQELSTAALALMMLIAPSVVVAVASRRFDGVALSKVWFHTPPAESWVPGWTAVVVVIGCGVVALTVDRWRSVPEQPEVLYTPVPDMVPIRLERV